MTFANRLDAQAVREAALAELGKAPQRVYFDEQADAAAANAYYRAVQPSDVANLRGLVTRTHMCSRPMRRRCSCTPGSTSNPTCP
jgi:hypothetical protein